MASVRAAAAAAGRAEPPGISVSFRPILAHTEEPAWERAHRILDTISAGAGRSVLPSPERRARTPERRIRLWATAVGACGQALRTRRMSRYISHPRQ
ncbi:hypothetical protein [Streptomyces sp. NPDC021212]|uniref:hypothetical protein n=1 Tax=Streptomyces sp. NPDC021212 TaxID=3365118 RepID=UPI00378F5DD7